MRDSANNGDVRKGLEFVTRRGEVGAWALLILLGLLLGGGLIEVSVRMLHVLPDRFWEPDPQLGWQHIARMTGWWTQEDLEFRVPVRISAQGLRDVEHAYTKAPGTTRVLLLGDSFIEALQVPLEQAVGRRLEPMLGAGVEVISAGVSGYGTASELLFLQREGFRYDPDVVVLAFYPGNDVKNNSPTLEDALVPRYDRDGRLLRVEKATGGDGALAQPRRGWHDWLKSYRYGRQLLLRHPGLARPLHRIGWLGVEGPRVAPERDGMPVDYGVFAPTPDAEWTAAWQHTERLLGDMRDAVTAQGRRFSIAVIPPRYAIYPQWWAEAVAAHPAMRGRQWAMNAPTQRVLRWCAEHAVPCLDLSAGLQATAQNGQPLYFHFDGHWTAAGHDAAARQLADFLHERQLVAVR